MQKSLESKAPNQLAVRKIIASDFHTVREKFIAKTFQTFKTIKKAFVEWKDHSTHIEFDHFKEMMESWGFANDCTELFNWLDFDKDGQISFNDLRMTAGVEIAPME